jgi:hypothetical protein
MCRLCLAVADRNSTSSSGLRLLLLLLSVQLCDGASPEERARWFLKPAQEFNYLNQSTCFDIPGDSNAEEYQVC